MIKSDSAQASSYALANESAASNLILGLSVELDEITTVQGNRRAHDVIQLSDQTASDISAAFKEAASDLNSVAIEFELLDAEQAKQFL